jgi:hypothetical protein
MYRRPIRGAEEDWTRKRVEEISKEEVKNPKDRPKHEPERDIEESERKD